MLQGTYTVSDLRKAKSALPTDADEYSDCRDVLSRAISAKTASSKPTPTSTPDQSSGAGGGTSGGSGGDGGSGTPPATTATRDTTVATDPGTETGPVTEQDWAAVGSATNEGDRGVAVQGRDVSGMLTASVGRNGLPASLLVALALLGGAVLAALLMPLRRRVAGHRE
jgi:hypothetical protein